MKQTTIRALGISVALIIAVLVSTMIFSGKVFARATDTAPSEIGIKVGTTIYHCQTLEVHLHGDQPATSICLDGMAPVPSSKSARQTSPDIKVDNSCSNYFNDLALWWDANYYGPDICFTGSGTANMTDYKWCNVFGCYSWNDQASSYATGCSPVTFYVNTNRKGSNVTVPPDNAGNFTPGAVPNDSLSSVYLSSNCS